VLEAATVVTTESRNKAVTYVVLVILIALWAMVLLPPFLKDRRSSGRTFGSMQTPTSSSGQRFLPLQQVTNRHTTAAVAKPTGMRTNPIPSGFTSLGALSHGSPVVGASNVVHLRPQTAADQTPSPGPLATSAADYLQDAPGTQEALLAQALGEPASAGLGLPSSTSAARERRRQVLLALTGVAFATLLLAIFAGGRWVAAHVFVDVVMVGYVILLVRHRQLAADRMMKVEPIRPPVSEQAPATLQAAPSYLLRSKTGS